MDEIRDSSGRVIGLNVGEEVAKIKAENIEATAAFFKSNIRNHAGNKYLRTVHSPVNALSIQVDVYAVLEAFGVKCPARQHAIKKLLCAGLRGKGSEMKDLEEAINSCGPRILELQRIREQTT